MLGLKSCNNATTGKVKNETKTQFSPTELQLTSTEFETIQMHTVGLIMPEILPYKKELPKLKTIKRETIECQGDEIKPDEIETINSNSIKEDTLIGAPLDPVIINSTNCRKGRLSVRMGGISSITSYVKNDTIPVNSKTDLIEQKFLAYPNPVIAGSMLTVKFPENNIPEKMQLILISGQIIATVEQDISDYATMCNIRIPSHVASGVYFLRLFSKEKILSTMKIVVG